MKRFFKLSGVFIFIFFIASLLLDVLFTTILSQSSERNKVENVIHSYGKKYDVIIMGTSRANNHFVTNLFEKKGLNSFNYGISGSHLFETSLLLKLMIANKFQIKNLILEADLSICNEKRDEGTTARFMPYIHTNPIIEEHYKNQSDFKQLYYLPFNRYIKFDAKIVKELSSSNELSLAETIKVMPNRTKTVGLLGIYIIIIQVCRLSRTSST
jgi:hypothetical protein